MNNTNNFVNSIMIKALILLFIESIIVFIFFKMPIPIFLGLFLGGTISIVFFRVIYLNILYAIEGTPKKAKRIMTVNYMVRYIISGIVLFVCARSEYLNIFSCALGLLTIKLTLYLNNFYSLLSRKRGSKSF